MGSSIRTAAVAAFLLFLATAPAVATTLVLPSDERLADKSDLVILGRVSESRPVGGSFPIWTETVIAVEATLKGTPAATVVVREPGGSLDSRRTVVFGSPEFAAGERVLVFLTADEGFHRVTDMVAGKFTHEVAGDGRAIWMRHLSEAGVRLLESGTLAEIDSAVEAGRVAVEFERFVRERAAGRPAPVASRAAAARPETSGEFALISEPTIYRWFAFDDGRTAEWRHHGTQSGYSSGGVDALKAGLGAWTSYSSAKIAFTHAGALSGSPGGLTRPNGINEVLFDDPLKEIAGSWNGTDGVVGTGGFNAVQGPRSWTSTFSADAIHVAKTWSAWDIVEGNLVIQDGIAPSAGISSSSLAEIIAHEFGHALGLGHSSDPLALMYASLQDLGVFLRADDQVAARWLYPSTGGSTPPPAQSPPAAPTNLSLVSASSDLVRIRWDDNATNETVQTIYFQPAGGTVRKFSDVPADVTAANLTGLAAGRTYRFHVTSKNAAGESAPSNAIEFTVPLPKLEASFAVSPKTGTATITLFSFYDQSKGSIASREWDFGDGSSSTAANPSHTYRNAGNFSVRLTVRSTDGQSSSAATTIQVAAAPQLVADFTWSPAVVVASTPVQFTDRSLGSAISWTWDFGDGSKSTERHPTKSWVRPGTYDVTLAISNGLQTSTLVRPVSVAAGSGAQPSIVAEFDASSFTPRADQGVEFRDQSSGGPDSWEWSFGDGSISTEQHPTHTWSTPGTYAVTLIARRGPAASTRTRSVIVREGARPVRLTLPVSAQTSGAGGSEWRTELSIHNAGISPADLTLTFLPDPGMPRLTKHVTLAPGETKVWARALVELFGAASGRGAIAIDASSEGELPDVHVASRTFTATQSDGSYGQAVTAFEEGSGADVLWLPGLESSSRYRTNVGWANRSELDVRLSFQLTDANGADLGSRSVDLAPRSFGQVALTSLYEFLGSQERAGMTLKVTSKPEKTAVVYASVIDNRSQDPVFVPARGAIAGSELLVPVVGKTAGAGGTFWRSDLAIFNPGSAQLRLQIRLLRADADNRSTGWRSIDLPPRRAESIRDVMEWLGAGSGSGALEVRWSGFAPVITSRTYTTRSADGGTFGQSIEAVPAAGLGARSVITGLRSDSEFRTNIGVVNGGETWVGANLDLYSTDGVRIAQTSVTMPPKSQSQWAAGALFPTVDAETLGSFTIVVSSNSAPTIFAYGSVVDRLSGDPIYISGR